MSITTSTKPRVLSGMRPTGKLHLGHYHGVLNNWRKLQDEYLCLYCIADWHALTTHYANAERISDNCLEMLIDWLISGVDPKRSIPFVQSQVPQHAELHLALSMITPLGWLERVPTYKDQIAKLTQYDLTTYGFLGYPVLQSADILVYEATVVPVGIDQVAHIEMTREIARKFNNTFGRGPEFEQTVSQALESLDASVRKKLKQARKRYAQKGDTRDLTTAITAVEQAGLPPNQQQAVIAWLEDRGLSILTEPHELIQEDAAKVPGIDGQKMSKSYGNSIFIRDDPDRIRTTIKAMPTDPARVRRDDPGTPEKCPVWNFHLLYTEPEERNRIHLGCTTAAIGCVDCKNILCDRLIAKTEANNAAARPYEQDKAQLLAILERGNQQARDIASQTMHKVREAMHLLTQQQP